MDKKVKELDLKSFKNIELYKNDYNAVNNLVVNHNGKNHNVTFFREPYTNDMIAAVLLYKRVPNGKIKVLYQKRIIPFWGETTEEMDVAIFAPCIKKGELLTESVTKEIEDKTGYDIKGNMEFKGTYYIYPKLATQSYLFFVDITHKVKTHTPNACIEEVFLDDENFKPAEPMLAIMMEMLKKETEVKEEPVEKPTFLEEHKIQINILIGAATGFLGIQVLLGIADMLRGLFG